MLNIKNIYKFEGKFFFFYFINFRIQNINFKIDKYELFAIIYGQKYRNTKI